MRRLMLVISLVCLLSRRSVNGGTIYAAAPEERGAYHVGGKGVYNYGYNTGDGIAKVEVKHPDGSVTGSYRYFDPNGQQIVRSYIADKRGFRVLGNELPSAPDTPAFGFLDSQILTGAVEGTQQFSTLSGPPTNEALVILDRQSPFNFVSHIETSGKSTNTIYDSNEKAKLPTHAHTSRFDNLLRELEEIIDIVLQQGNNKQTAQIGDLTYKLKGIREELNRKDEAERRVDYTSYSAPFETGAGGNYFISDDRINYDFPAGFAYATQTVPGFLPVGVKGSRAENPLTAGHNRNLRHNYVSIAPSRAPQTRQRNPYVIGYRH